MKEKIVSFEQAKWLEEIGFRSHCMNMYVNEILYTLDEFERYANGVVEEDPIEAPTLIEANDWLRENKKWYVNVFPVWMKDTNELNWGFRLVDLTNAKELEFAYLDTDFYKILSKGLDEIYFYID